MAGKEDFQGQDPRIGRFIENNCALFFMPASLNDGQGRVLWWNHHAERVSGLPASSVLGGGEYARLLGEEVSGPCLLDLFLAGDKTAIEKIYGPEHLLWDAADNLVVLDCQAAEPAEPAGPENRRLLLCGRWRDSVSGESFSYLAWSWLRDYEFTRSPSIDLYRLLQGLDRKRSAWFGIQQSELYCYLSGDFIRALFPSGVGMEEVIGTPMSQAMTPAAAMDHARTIASLTPEQSAETVLNWPHVFRYRRQAWVQSYPNVLVVNGQRANFSLVQDVTAERERDFALENLLTTYRLTGAGDSGGPASQLLSTFAGRSKAIRETIESLLRAALSLVTVAIYGETGTGKNLAARLVHLLSSRSSGPFVAVNCGAIPEELFESAFFGHVKGAFTGAVADKDGLLTCADAGTLFLDEIAELSPRAQAKMLQALSEKSYAPVGSTRVLASKFRLVAATNRNLEEMVRQGLFREDLYYRVNVVDIQLPPLRERREDIPLLVGNILRQHAIARYPSPDDFRLLESHYWPGNVRELENVTLRYASDGNLDFFKPSPLGGFGPASDAAPELSSEKGEQGGPADSSLKARLERHEREILMQTLTRHRWNRGQAARELGISRVTLFRKMRDLDLL